MLCINLENTNPFFCLAAEEYLLRYFDDDVFMLWQSDKTIVVGKHQNALAEINYPSVRQNNIVVARRISGGGTVYHDEGNVNFAFIKNVKSPAEISFKQFTEPIVEALAKLGIVAVNSGRNDLVVNGLKISGNAEHVYKNRVLHHGTLLFDADLENLGQAIKVVPGKYISKAVQSNRSKVVNISAFLKKRMSTEEFKRVLFNFQLKKEEARVYEISENESKSIQNLATEKFSTWEWNFGYSPKYTFKNKAEIEGKSLSVLLYVKKGIIEEATISGDYFNKTESERINADLLGARHHFEEIESILRADFNELIYLFF
jgi:lipoate-protein ligase A